MAGKVDEGHAETDELLEEVEKKLRKEYKQAYEETEKKLEKYLSRFASKDEKWKKDVAAGKKTKAEHDEWRKGQMMMSKRWEEMRNSLAQDYHNANAIAHSIVNGYTPDAYALNHNYATFEVESGSMIDTSYTLYDRATVEMLMRDNPDLLPKPGKSIESKSGEKKDIRWQEGQIQSVTLQSILQGESIPNMAKRISREMGEENYANAVRYARTAVTGAENAGRIDAYNRAVDLGIDMKKMWIATLDNRTRHSHREVDGEAIDVNDTFSNGCEYPGDPAGPPEEVWNCRCTLGSQIKGFEIDHTDTSLRYNDRLGDMSYDEWKEEHRVSAADVEVGRPIDIEKYLPDWQMTTLHSEYQAVIGGWGFKPEVKEFLRDNDIPEEAITRIDFLMDGHANGGEWQKESDAEIVEHIRNMDEIGKAFMLRSDFEMSCYEEWKEHHPNSPQLDSNGELRVFRKGSRKDGVESWTIREDGADMGHGGIGYDHVSSLETLLKEGYVPIAGFGTKGGASGEGEITFVKVYEYDERRRRRLK